MINIYTLKIEVLKKAFSGKLTNDIKLENDVISLIQKNRVNLTNNKKSKVKINDIIVKRIDDDFEYFEGNEKIDVPFAIPHNWQYFHQQEICFLDNGTISNAGELPYLEAKVLRGIKEPDFLQSGIKVTKGSKVILVDGENSGEVMTVNRDGYMGSTFKILSINNYMCPEFVYYWILLNKELYRNNKKGSAIPHLNKELFKNYLIPVPPYKEQELIVKKIKSALKLIELINTSIDNIQQYKEMLRFEIIDYAIKGNLIKHLSEFGNIKEDLLKNTYYQECKKAEIKPLFNISETWIFAKLGDLLKIERGGSPRPIEAFLTDGDGFNWIKIGDTVKGDKYITKTAQKIKKEGLNKTRYVEPGDFILSNSMSFGRPYILKIDGCIHDGWLVFRNPETAFDKDFLFYLLSSKFVYNQFADLAHGSGVKNLNIDRVKGTVVPVPPIKEQIQIKNIIKKAFQILNIED